MKDWSSTKTICLMKSKLSSSGISLSVPSATFHTVKSFPFQALLMSHFESGENAWTACPAAGRDHATRSVVEFQRRTFPPTADAPHFPSGENASPDIAPSSKTLRVFPEARSTTIRPSGVPRASRFPSGKKSNTPPSPPSARVECRRFARSVSNTLPST